MTLAVTAYNLTRAINVLGTRQRRQGTGNLIPNDPK
jgi:hypothetical protein